MASFKELRRLRDEERTLVHIASKINDQLNRLKVEELALLSAIRMDEKKKSESDNVTVTQHEDAANKIMKGEKNAGNMDQPEAEMKQAQLPDIDLTVSKNTGEAMYEEEEEEEDELNNMMTALQE